MPLRRRRLLLFGLPVALVLLGLGILALWPRPSAINPENDANIRDGMTRAEVEDLLGGPARNESGLPDNFINDAFVVTNPLRPGGRPLDEQRWASPGYLVVVLFDDSGRVVRHTRFAFEVDRSFLDKLRRWLHL
jgi:hypothetical protein